MTGSEKYLLIVPVSNEIFGIISTYDGTQIVGFLQLVLSQP